MQRKTRGAQFFGSMEQDKWREQQQTDSILKEHKRTRGQVRRCFSKRAHHGNAEKCHDNKEYPFG